MIIDPKDYPNVTWRWRVFNGGNFLTYINATVPQLMLAQSTMAFSIDEEYRSINIV